MIAAKGVVSNAMLTLHDISRIACGSQNPRASYQET